jgi:hypothetical protein
MSKVNRLFPIGAVAVGIAVLCTGALFLSTTACGSRYATEPSVVRPTMTGAPGAAADPKVRINTDGGLPPGKPPLDADPCPPNCG